MGADGCSEPSFMNLEQEMHTISTAEFSDWESTTLMRFSAFFLGYFKLKYRKHIS
jgi:hypothetical protein